MPEHPPRIDSIFADLRARDAKGLMPFVCAGHPAPDALNTVLPALDAAGATAIEIGIPFSDPIADGPVIAAAMHEALTNGFRPQHAFEQVAAARDRVDAALIAMVSVSIVARMGGPEGFTKLAKDAGIDGFIYPDAPVEESAELVAAATDAGLTAALLVAPTTPPPRLDRIAQTSTGFVYLLARAGITGERDDAPDVAGPVQALRRLTDLPIACGFGISSPAHVARVVEHADAAIVGSALVRRLADAHAADPARDPAETAAAFVRELAEGLTPHGQTTEAAPDRSTAP